jgi:enoyl-CoA hydratase/carnithine racemase
MTYGAYEQLLASLDEEILTITLNRPEKLNPYGLVMGRELRDVFERASTDDSVRAIIVTGAGRGFCSGADLSSGSESFAERREIYARSMETRIENRFVDAIYNCHKPSIAAINGAAVGVGITMTLPMDVRIASTRAKVGFIFARRGLVLEAGCAWFLPRVVGLPQALRWCYGAQVFEADEALRGGLVSEVVEPEDLLARARAIAEGFIRGTAPVSIALTRHLLYELSNSPGPEPVLELDAKFNRELGAGEDVREGIRAYMEKRSPGFPGRAPKDFPVSSPWSGPKSAGA